ncbi:MAG TPA: anthrone oxygenase family protein [Candidatus Acidoferrum sp.]
MLFQMLHVIAITLVSLAMAPAVAHALELPGKVRLPKEAYVTVQQIYYPGFTIAGFGEVVAVIAVALLLWSTPRGTVAFWLALGALLGVLAMQAVYWIAIHPINKFWLQGKSLGAAGSRFFSFDPTSRKQDRSRQPYDWTRLRDRWELSHVARAVLALVSLVLVAAVNA